MRPIVFLLALAVCSPGAILTVTSSSSTWNGLVNPGSVVSEGFENASSGFITRISNGGTGSVAYGTNSYAIDRATDSISRLLEIAAGAYAITGVLSNQNSANLELANLIVTPTAPIQAFAVNHSAWRGTQVQFTLTFSDLSQQSFLANTSIVNPSAPMAFTGVVSDVGIIQIRLETTVSANDNFGRGLNIDNFSTASNVPEPATLGLSVMALLLVLVKKAQKP